VVLHASLDAILLDMLHLANSLSLAEGMCCLCISRDTSSSQEMHLYISSHIPCECLSMCTCTSRCSHYECGVYKFN
jgi:hypothetical protein